MCSANHEKGVHDSIGYNGYSTENSPKPSKKSHLVNCPNTNLIRSIERVKQRLHKVFGITLYWIYVDGHKYGDLK